MKSYKEMAESLEIKIYEAMEKSEDVSRYTIFSAVDSWLAFIERDTETSESKKKAKYSKMLEGIENMILDADIRKNLSDRVLNLTFAYVALREKLEVPEDERKARITRLRP